MDSECTNNQECAYIYIRTELFGNHRHETSCISGIGTQRSAFTELRPCAPTHMVYPQRYHYKLDEEQPSTMTRRACTESQKTENRQGKASPSPPYQANAIEVELPR